MAERDLQRDIEAVGKYMEHVGTRFERRVNEERMKYILGSGILDPDVVTHIKLAIRRARLTGVIAGMQHVGEKTVSIEDEGIEGNKRPLSSIIEEGEAWNRLETFVKQHTPSWLFNRENAGKS